MKNNRLHNLLTASLLALVASLAACTTGKSYAKDAAPLEIAVLQDGSCKVRTEKMACSDTSVYIRDVLKLSPPVHCSIDARSAPSYESVQDLFEGLRGSGCKVGFVNVSER